LYLHIAIIYSSLTSHSLAHKQTTQRTALFWVTTQRVVVISYQRFRTTYRSHAQVQESRTLKMGLIGCPETSVRKYHYSLRNNPEERNSQLLHGGSLKSTKQTSKQTHTRYTTPFAVTNKSTNFPLDCSAS